MAVTCTTSSLAAQIGCLMCLNDDQLDGITSYLWVLYFEQQGAEPPVDFLLLETGGNILQESGDRIGLE